MSKILLVGGAGYVGSVLAEELLERGYAVKILDRLYYGEDGLRDIRDRVELVMGDMRAVGPEVLEGVDAVCDKDLASAVLARDLGAPVFISATSIEQVFLDFGKPTARPLDVVTLAEAKGYLDERHFGEGSMRPKVAAIIKFLEGGGTLGVVTTPELVPAALQGKAGTRFVP